MRKNILITPLAVALTALLAPLLAVSPLSAQELPKQEHPSPNAIVEAAPASDWKAIAASDLLVMDLAPDAKGEARRVVIQLMPPPFSQGWIGNIRKLAAAKFWDGTSINRVQDNYVVQWGDAAEEESDRKPLPDGLEVVAESDYQIKTKELIKSTTGLETNEAAESFAEGEVAEVIREVEEYRDTRPGELPPWMILWKALGKNPYSKVIAFVDGWPVAASDGGIKESIWPIHCYGAVGVGRNLSPDTGTGAELYTVIGHAPRHLDRNIAVVGRVIEGIEHLSSLPRGKGQLGFYANASKRVPIRSIRLGNALLDTEPPRFEYLETDSTAFAQYADARANRRDPFFVKPAGGADICNIPVPVRRLKAN